VVRDKSACILLSRTLSETYSLLAGHFSYDYDFVEKKLAENTHVIENSARDCLDDNEYKLLRPIINYITNNIRARLSFITDRASDEEILCNIRVLSNIVDNMVVNT